MPLIIPILNIRVHRQSSLPHPTPQRPLCALRVSPLQPSTLFLSALNNPVLSVVKFFHPKLLFLCGSAPLREKLFFPSEIKNRQSILFNPATLFLSALSSLSGKIFNPNPIFLSDPSAVLRLITSSDSSQ